MVAVRELQLPAEISRRSQDMPRGLAHLWAIECSPQECDEIGQVDELALHQLEEFICSLLETHTATPSIPVLCLGASADPRWLPAEILDPLRTNSWWGIWLRSPGLVVVRLQPRWSADSIIIHEMAHAVLDHQSRGFSFPLTLNEGFACICERRYRPQQRTNPKRDRSWNRGAGYGGSLSPMEMLSIAELFAHGHRGTGLRSGMVRFTRASYWLVDFLGYLGRVHPAVLRIMAELRNRQLSRPGEVLNWLERASGQTSSELEAKFREFCAKGGRDRQSPTP